LSKEIVFGQIVTGDNLKNRSIIIILSIKNRK